VGYRRPGRTAILPPTPKNPEMPDAPYHPILPFLPPICRYHPHNSTVFKIARSNHPGGGKNWGDNGKLVAKTAKWG